MAKGESTITDTAPYHPGTSVNTFDLMCKTCEP
jgi:hypothetical protein